MTCVSLVYVHLAICTIMFKRSLISASCKGNIIDINANDVPIEQFRFHKCCTTASELIENQISPLRISEQNVPRNVW